MRPGVVAPDQRLDLETGSSERAANPAISRQLLKEDALADETQIDLGDEAADNFPAGHPGRESPDPKEAE